MEYPKSELFEKLADIEHQRWADWQKYLHSKILPSGKDGIMEIGTELIEHWNRQINTDYKNLSEAEKDSDREQVMRYWDLIKKNVG